ncbi:MAG: hypothetical protein R3194_09195, partial [Limnobacter sp.]|nr:hypothetical protein [Limnobacter sp.]
MKSDSASKEQPVAPNRFWTGLFTVLLGLYLAGGGAFLLAKWIIVPNLHGQKEQIEAYASQMLGQKVQSTGLSIELTGFGLALEVDNLSIQNDVLKPAVQVRKVSAYLPLMNLLTGSLNFRNLEVIDPKVRAEYDGKVWKVAGMALDLSGPPSENSVVLDWLLAQQRLLIVDGEFELEVTRPDQPVQARSLRGIHALAQQSLGQHQIELKFTEGSWFDQPVIAKASFDAPVWGKRRTQWKNWTGQLFMQAKLNALQNFPVMLLPPDM